MSFALVEEAIMCNSDNKLVTILQLRHCFQTLFMNTLMMANMHKDKIDNLNEFYDFMWKITTD